VLSHTEKEFIVHGHDFYGDWIFYGGCLGVIGVGISAHIYGKKIGGADKLTGKQNLVIITVFLFPTVILPLMLTPVFSVTQQILIISGLVLFGILRYYVSTRAHERYKKIKTNGGDSGSKPD
jgi:hypothetical protein